MLTAEAREREAQSGLPPWVIADLPTAPNVRGLRWLGVVGPGVIASGYI